MLDKTIKEALTDGAYTVVFEKSDGSTREMVCTTKHDLIAEANGRDLTPRRLEERTDRPEGLVVAYDLVNLGWRSFYADRVKSFEPFMENGVHVTEPV